MTEPTQTTRIAELGYRVKRALSGDLYALLTDIQNGIDAPGHKDMANSAIQRIDALLTILEGDEDAWSQAQPEQPEAGRDDAQAQEADWTDRELKLIQFAMYRFMNDAYSQANYAAQRGTADQVRAFHADAKDAEAILAKLRTLAPPVSAEAGRDEYHRCGKNIRRHKVSECRPQAQEAVAEVVEVGGSLGELRIIRWIKDPLPVGAKLFAAPPANAEAVRMDAALADWQDELGQAYGAHEISVEEYQRCISKIMLIRTFAQHGGRDDVR